MEGAAARAHVVTGLDLVLTADVAQSRQPGCETYKSRNALGARRERLERLVGNVLLSADVLHVDHRARAGDGHRFRQPPHAELRFNVRRKSGREIDALASDAGEAL